MKTFILALSLACAFSSVNVSARERLTFCTDRSFWFPFVFTELYKPTGLYIDMAKDAMDRLDYRISIRPMDWKKCLRRAKSGRVDGVLGASYKDKRAEFLHYPSDAKSAKESPQRLTTVEYVVVNNIDENYLYEGSVDSLPTPVRVPRSYSVADDLRGQGVEVDDKSKGDQGTLLRLVTDKTGSVVTLRTVADHYSNHPVYKGKITVQEKAYKAKPYFVTFSKKANIPEEKMMAVWDAIKAVREDESLMAGYLEKYQAQE